MKTANELSRYKDLNTAQDATIANLREENARAEKLIEHLTNEVQEAKSHSELAEKQYMGLKDTIRSLQNENDELKKENRKLVDRLVTEKEKAVEEINKMNELTEKLVKEVDMLKTLEKHEEKRKKGGGWFHFGDDKHLKNGSEDKSSSSRNMGSGRMWGTIGVIIPTQPKHIVQAHPSEATCVRYDGTGSDLVATAGSDNTVKIWDTNSATLRTTLHGGSGHAIIGCDISGGLAVGCGSDKTCRVWNLRTQRMIHLLAGHSNKITCVRLFHGEKCVITGSADRSLKVWDISRNTYRQTTTFRHSSTSNCIDVSNESDNVVSGHMDGGIRFWDVRSGERTADISSLHEGGVTSVHFHPKNSTELLTNGRDSMLKVVDIRTCTPIQTLMHEDFRTMFNWSSCSFSPDGMYAAAGSDTTGDILIWRVLDGELEKKLSSHQAGVAGFAWGRGGSNGQQVASVDRSGVLVLWA